MGRDEGTPLARFALALVREDGFAFGAPSASDDGAAAVVPILRVRPGLRRYVVAGEAPGMVSATDRGRIDRLVVSNESPNPVLLLPGTLFLADETAARATTAGLILPSKSGSEVEVKCVHASQPLSADVQLDPAPRLAPARVTRALLSRDQGLVWSAVEEHVAMSEASMAGTPAQRSDDLAAAISRDASDAGSPAYEAARDQCGAVWIQSDGVAALECFDHPESWAAAGPAIFRRYDRPGGPVARGPWSLSLDATGALRLAKEFIASLAQVPVRKAGSTGFVATDASLAYATLDRDVIYLIAFAGRSSGTAVAAATAPDLGTALGQVPAVAPQTIGEPSGFAPSDEADVGVAAVPVADAQGDDEPSEAVVRPRRRKVLTSGWDERTFAVLDRCAQKEFRGDRSAAMRFLVRQGLRRRGYFGPLPPVPPATPGPTVDSMAPSAELLHPAMETRLQDLGRIAETPIYAGWLRKRAVLEIERMATSMDDDLLRTSARSLLDRLPPIEPEPPVVPEEIPEELPEAVEPTVPAAPAPVPPTPPPSPIDVRASLREAFAASAVGDYRQAIALFDRVLDADRENRTARLGRALSLRRSGKSSESLADLDDILRVEPRNAAALLARGRILQERGDLPDALGVFDLLVDVAPNDWDVWMARGEVLAKMNRTEDALRAYRESLRRNPENAELEKRVRVLEASHPAPAPRTLPRPTLPREIEEGQSYLVREARHDRSQALFRAVAALKVPALVLTSRSRDLVRKELGVSGARILSLSFTPGEDHHNPTALASLTRIIERFIEDNQGHGVVLLDGLDELVTNNGFRDTVLCIERVHETILQSRAIFLISIGPGDIGEKQVALLERSLRVIG